MGKMSRRAKAAKGASKLAAKRAAALHDPLRPKLLDEPPCSGEDGEDSFRCFHVGGRNVVTIHSSSSSFNMTQVLELFSIADQTKYRDSFVRMHVCS